MKKLFTLVALLAVFMGAKAEWVEDYSIDYSTKERFPFYVMGYVPEWVSGVMTDYGAEYRYATQADLDGDGDAKWKDGESAVGTAEAGDGNVTEYQKVTGAGPYWHQYIIAAEVPMELDGTYTIKAMVKSSAAVNANLQFGNWGSLKEMQVAIPQSDDFQEVEWEVTGCLYAGKGFICIQPGTSTATIEWKSLTVSHNAKPSKPIVWQEWLTSDGQPVIVETTPAAIPTWMGNAETPWGDLANVKYNDQTQNYLICAWSKERMVNQNDDGGWDPFPATIEAEEGNPENHVFVCHGKAATTEGDAAAWDNQFWIQSPKGWPDGSTIKVSFRYKASKAVTTQTQVHFQNPSDYKVWHAIGDIAFTTEWQEFNDSFQIPSDGNSGDGWSIAFNLNANDKEAIDFYFDDLSWQTMKLEEGYFVAGQNKQEGIEYDYDNAIKFDEHEYDDDYDYVATIGEDGWVNEIRISTVRGHTGSFLSNTLKPGNGNITASDPENWIEYTASSNATIKLPAAGKWTIYIDTQMGNMAFEMLEGEDPAEPVDIITNTTENVINATERDWKPAKDDGSPQDGEEGIGTGQPWDNQFWIAAKRDLSAGEVTVVKFQYKASKAAHTSAQAHKMGDDGKPCTYLNWQAIDNVDFTEEWQDFEQDFTIPEGSDGMRSIVFNLSEIKDACDYYIKNVQWYLKDETLNAEGKTIENLIKGDDSDFWTKVDKGAPTGIIGVVNDFTNTTGSNVIYNLSGQRVTEDYKGVVIKNGRKVVNK